MRKYTHKILSFTNYSSTCWKLAFFLQKLNMADIRCGWPLTNLGPDMGAIVGPTDPDDIFQPGERGGQRGSQVITLHINNLDKFEWVLHLKAERDRCTSCLLDRVNLSIRNVDVAFGVSALWKRPWWLKCPLLGWKKPWVTEFFNIRTKIRCGWRETKDPHDLDVSLVNLTLILKLV